MPSLARPKDMVKFFSNKTAETTFPPNDPVFNNFKDAAKSAVDKYLQKTEFIRIVHLKPEYCTTVLCQEGNEGMPKWVVLWRQGGEELHGKGGFYHKDAPQDLESKLKSLANKGDGYGAEEIHGMMWMFEKSDVENPGWKRKGNFSE